MYTFQALSEEDRDLWLNAMDGKEPMFVHPPKPSDANETYLDEAGFNFIAKSFQVLENRGRSLDMGSLDPSSLIPCLKLTLKRFKTLSPEFVSLTRDEHLLRWEGITSNCTNNFRSASPPFFFSVRIEKQLERAGIGIKQRSPCSASDFSNHFTMEHRPVYVLVEWNLFYTCEIAYWNSVSIPNFGSYSLTTC